MQALSIELFLPLTTNFTYRCNLIAIYRNICVKRFVTGAINYVAAANNYVMSLAFRTRLKCFLNHNSISIKKSLFE